MKLSFLQRLAAGAGIVALLLPSASFAATNQQLLDASLASLGSYPAFAFSGSMTVTVTQRALRKDYQPQNATITFSYTDRVVKTSTSTHDSEGYISIDKIQVTGLAQDPGTSVLSALGQLGFQPIRIDWKKSGTVGYIFVESLPQSLIDLAGSTGVDVTEFTNRWISFDLSELTGAVSERQNIDPSVLANPQSLSAFKQPLRVRRVDKRFINAAGDHIVRLRIGLNPVLIAQAQNDELRKVDRTVPGWRTRISEINKSYATMRAQLAHIGMIAQINQDKGTLDRIEVGASFTERKQTCTMDYDTFKSVCRSTHTETTGLAMGINIRNDDGAPVVAPSPSISIQDLMAEIEAKMNAAASTTPAEPPPEESTSSSMMQ